MRGKRFDLGVGVPTRAACSQERALDGERDDPVICVIRAPGPVKRHSDIGSFPPDDFRDFGLDVENVRVFQLSIFPPQKTQKFNAQYLSRFVRFSTPRFTELGVVTGTFGEQPARAATIVLLQTAKRPWQEDRRE